MGQIPHLKFTKLNNSWVKKRLPIRSKEAHKGTFGKVLVIAGSVNYPGAAYLACAACYKVGAGLVTLTTDPEVKIIVSKKLPEVTFFSYDELLDNIDSYDVLLVGPGLGQSKQTIKLVEQLVDNKVPPTVIDGDGLNILTEVGKWWEKLVGETILTPHLGEMVRLTGLNIKEIQTDRFNVAQYYAKKWNKIVVLKGANTLVASPAGSVLLSPFANSVLATAGTGDVLAGVIAGLVAQGLKPFDAAGVGVYIHGLSGEILSNRIGNAGGLASEILPILPQVLKELR